MPFKASFIEAVGAQIISDSEKKKKTQKTQQSVNKFQINLNSKSQFVLNQHFASFACGILDPVSGVFMPDLLYR